MATNTLQTLADKGNGTLVRVGQVWTYPGAPFDPSGTNLRLPLEYVSDADVQAALQDGSWAAASTGPAGTVQAIRLAGSGIPVISAGLAGSAEMGTELPIGSRVEQDAGSAPMTQAEAEKAALASAPGKPGEGAEIKGRDPALDPRPQTGGAGPFGKEASTDVAGARKGR